MKTKELHRLNRQFPLLHQKTEYCWSHVRETIISQLSAFGTHSRVDLERKAPQIVVK